MAVKLYKPTTPARRGMTSVDTSMVTKKRPEKSLIVAKKAGSGRATTRVRSRSVTAVVV